MSAKYYYAFRGQNATIGRPNSRTGLMSLFGDVIAFTSRAKRDEYVAEYCDDNPSLFVEACNSKSARQYCLGMSVDDFEDYMAHTRSIADEHYDSWNYKII